MTDVAQHGRMRRPAEELHERELTLRRWTEADAATVHRVAGSSVEHLAPWMWWAVGGYTVQDAVAFVTGSRANWEAGNSFDYAIVERAGGIVGSAGLMARIGPDGFEIGYWLHHESTGKGIATRAASMLVDEAFRVGATRVEIVHDVGNYASGRIPPRLGFTEIETRESTEPGGELSTGTVRVWRKTPLRAD